MLQATTCEQRPYPRKPLQTQAKLDGLSAAFVVESGGSSFWGGIITALADKHKCPKDNTTKSARVAWLIQNFIQTN